MARTKVTEMSAIKARVVALVEVETRQYMYGYLSVLDLIHSTKTTQSLELAGLQHNSYFNHRIMQ